MAQTGTPLDSMLLWRSTLAPQGDDLDQPREVLRQSFLGFRNRVKDLVSTLGAELPNLTVHDITHLDALWRVASEIAGDNYPLNPAEAYVLGGAFLLHDAAHVLAAYPGGLKQIKQTVQWQDFVAQRSGGVDPPAGSVAEKSAIFQVLRHLHAGQAYLLPKVKWKVPGSGEELYLIESYELREYFGDLIGQMAASHHWPAAKVASTFRHRIVACPAALSPASWQVDALKVALLLRTADAAHLDAQRAPWFLFALRQPQGISADHWRFQAKMGQPTRSSSGELSFTSGATFGPNERAAWWLALETGRMVDGELRSAHEILREEGRAVFAASTVLGIDSAEAFAKHVPPEGWEPVDVAPKVGDVAHLVSSLGGAALYGETYAAPLRELLQNGLDAVAALRALGNADSDEGEVVVEITPASTDEWWLSVTDTGIGMSRFVLTNVLMDFGSSLWASDAVRDELPGLAKTQFKPVGKFGIGFFSVFMLGKEVRVTTRRYQPSPGEATVNWQLQFDDGLASRPALLRVNNQDALSRSGTRVAVKLDAVTLKKLLGESSSRTLLDVVFGRVFESDKNDSQAEECNKMLAWLVAGLCPASSVRLTSRFCMERRYLAVGPSDWLTIADDRLTARVRCSDAPLFPLRTAKGRVLGRVGFGTKPSLHNNGSIVYQGVVCGRMKGLIGVVQARANNDDARRASARPAGTLSEWQGWAAQVLEASPKLEPESLIRLHPLLPNRDLAVWTLGDETLTLAELMAALEGEVELWLHNSDVGHEDADGMSESRFASWFRRVERLVCIPEFSASPAWWYVYDSVTKPSRDDALPWFLDDVLPIDYAKRFEDELTARWGEFEAEEVDECVVGYVDETEITRSVTRYRRVVRPK